ncbi:MAG TPA: HAD family phosphatase [Terriglobia bacterium]|nr:HAD family phosphatase [Terriglobia bacterium]
MKLAPFQGVIFDCDGVLVDSEPLGLRSLQQALGEAGVGWPIESLKKFSGRSHSETLSEVAAETGVPLLARGVQQQMDNCYEQLTATQGLRACAGVPRFLAQLTNHQIPFTLASSGTRRKVLTSLRAAGLVDAFPRFVCGDDVARAKPAPDIYIAAAACLGLFPADCLAIEDAPSGIRSARQAGMQVVAVSTTFPMSALAEANLILDSLESFPLQSTLPGRGFTELRGILH